MLSDSDSPSGRAPGGLVRYSGSSISSRMLVGNSTHRFKVGACRKVTFRTIPGSKVVFPSIHKCAGRGPLGRHRADLNPRPDLQHHGPRPCLEASAQRGNVTCRVGQCTPHDYCSGSVIGHGFWELTDSEQVWAWVSLYNANQC